MNKKILVIAILIMLNIILTLGCIDEEKNNGKYDIYVKSSMKSDINTDFSNIQDAIDYASDGDSIYIYDGIYNESIFINKSLNIKAQSQDKTIINFDISDNKTKSLITINSDNCTLDGFKINNSINEILNGILITSSNNIIINCTISNFDKGIFIDSNYNDNYINNTIEFNNLSNNGESIFIQYSTNNNISNNYISLTKTYGIYLYSADDNHVSNNSVIKNTDYGIRIKGSRGNIVINNNISGNKRGLLFCCGARNNIVYSNNFINNAIYNADDRLGNIWDNGSIGNYWDDYIEKYPNSEIIDKIWSIPYNITNGYTYADNYPLTNPI